MGGDPRASMVAARRLLVGLVSVLAVWWLVVDDEQPAFRTRTMLGRNSADLRTFHVIVPFGKMPDADSLERCIESVVQQTHQKKVLWIIRDGPLTLADHPSNRAFLAKVCGHAFSALEKEGTISAMWYRDNPVVCLQTSQTRARGPAFSKYFGFQQVIKSPLARDDDVLMIVDGDDYLVSNEVLGILNQEYKERNCLCSWGSMRGLYAEQQGPLDQNGVATGSARHSKWTFAHPRTLTVSLAKHIPATDFQDANGFYVWKGSDRGFVYRMIELAGPPRACFIDRGPLYQYVTNGAPKTNKNVNAMQRAALLNHFATMDPSSPLHFESLLRVN